MQFIDSNNKQYKPVLEVEEKNNFKVVKIFRECTFEELSKYRLNIPMESLLKSDSKESLGLIRAQKVYIINNNGITYYIAISDDDIAILERKIELDTRDISFKVNPISKSFSVSMHLFDSNNVTKAIKHYPFRNENFSLEKKDALGVISQLLCRLENVPNIERFLRLNRIYQATNLVSQDKFFPVISDGVVTLSWRYRKCDDIDLSDEAYLDIILNETKEKVGFIFFNYNASEESLYDGNVGYRINKDFRNNHYASRALGLLKLLVKGNKSVSSKDIYISTIPSNEISQKVIINNGGEMVYFGNVPESDPLYYMDGVEKVKIYRIDI